MGRNLRPLHNLIAEFIDARHNLIEDGLPGQESVFSKLAALPFISK